MYIYKTSYIIVLKYSQLTSKEEKVPIYITKSLSRSLNFPTHLLTSTQLNSLYHTQAM